MEVKCDKCNIKIESGDLCSKCNNLKIMSQQEKRFSLLKLKFKGVNSYSTIEFSSLKFHPVTIIQGGIGAGKSVI